jgi:hypothetical protein
MSTLESHPHSQPKQVSTYARMHASSPTQSRALSLLSPTAGHVFPSTAWGTVVALYGRATPWLAQ